MQLTEPENMLSLKGIKKSFGGVRALKGVDLTIKKGEIHCLAGENGCGKSTVIKVVSGFYQPDEGTIEVLGKPYPVMTPTESIKAGIQVIYQDFSIFPNLTVTENLAFNQVLAQKKKFVNHKEFRRIAERAVSKINFDVDLDAMVERLPVADKQLIAISRALLDDAKLIIMDEPTTALTKKEVQRLFEIINDLKKNGVTILFVSHKLDEVYEISDSITIFRNGENVITCPIADMAEDKFAYYMTGRSFESYTKEEKVLKDEEAILEVENLSAQGFEDISFSLKRGEVLGIVGQLGSGRTELSLSLFGICKPTAGKIKVNGKEVQINSVTEAEELGIALVPEDRLTEGLFLPQSIVRNITVAKLDKLAGKFGVANNDVVAEESQKWVDTIGVATDNHFLPVMTLSGGNQQKTLLARWLSLDPKILVLNGPTVGVDIGAKHDIHKLLRDCAASGMAIIVVSDDPSDILNTCDRVIVMKKGRITGHLSSAEVDAKTLSESTV